MELYFSKTLKIDDFSGIHLLQDHIGTFYGSPWNDYDYIVKFKIYYVEDGLKQSLGMLRLLVNGQQNTSNYLVEKGVAVSDKIYLLKDVINDTNAVSLPLEIEYYHKINKLLEGADISIFLEKLCDASYFYGNFNTYKKWEGFMGSIMRESSASEAILKKGHQIAIGRYTPKKKFDIEFESSSELMESATFYFDKSKSIGKANINLLTGKNGVGKSFLLKELTEVIVGIKPSQGSWPYFHKLIVVAYSPFENFHTKNQVLTSLKQKYSKNKKINKKENPKRGMSINEYAYIGFRNESGKFDIEWPEKHSVESLINILKYDDVNSWWELKPRFQILKETLSLCVDFDEIAVKMVDQIDFVVLNEKTLDEIEIKKVAVQEGIFFIKDGKPLSLSSGQKIFSYMIPSIVSEIEEESLVIVDEPELYLHPHLEVGFINMMKYLLSETSSCSIIASHSAILTREIKKQGVKVLRKKDGVTSVSQPSLQTYGESLESIIGEVFDDYSSDKAFYKEIDAYITTHENNVSLEQLSPLLGDEALAYISSKLENGMEFKVSEDK